MAELKRLTQFCNYGTVLNDMLHDRLVCGLNHKQIQQKLLSEGSTLTLEKALSTSTAVESAINQSSLSSQHQANPINKEDPPNIFEISESKSEKPCYRCNGNHRPETCAFKDKE